MQYEIKIKRSEKNSSVSYWQSFLFEGDGEETIAAVLDHLNTDDDLFDKEGKPARKIIWSCSCNQGICGACAMVINKVPRLACKTKLKDIKGTLVVLEPLTKFPLFADLETDRTCLYEVPIEHKIWNNGKAIVNAKQHNLEYEASKCIKCGICVEVCPNTDILDTNLGSVFAVDCYLKWVQNSDSDDKKRIKKEYNKHFASGCSKSMSCAENCPAGIDIRKLVNLLNR